jgi:transposase
MIGFTSSQRYFLYGPSTDMRKSFDSLCGLVSSQMKRNILSGDVFIFVNRDRNRVKLMVWDRSGFVIWYKRLEEGTFELPQLIEGRQDLELKWERLVMILEGIQLSSVKQRKRYAMDASLS